MKADISSSQVSLHSPDNKLIKAKRKKTLSTNNKINLKNILIPKTNIKEVNQTINVKQEYFLPIYNNSSPNEARSKLMYHNPKPTLLNPHKRREKSLNIQNHSSNTFDKSGLIKVSKPEPQLLSKTEQDSTKLLKKKSYSFHRIIDHKE